MRVCSSSSEFFLCSTGTAGQLPTRTRASTRLGPWIHVVSLPTTSSTRGPQYFSLLFVARVLCFFIQHFSLSCNAYSTLTTKNPAIPIISTSFDSFFTISPLHSCPSHEARLLVHPDGVIVAAATPRARVWRQRVLPTFHQATIHRLRRAIEEMPFAPSSPGGASCP